MKCCVRSLLPVSSSSRLRIGILGGSFNPAHNGHQYITLQAIKRFALHKVIWFVTPQNPLKAVGSHGSLEGRMSQARMVAAHGRIVVSDFEKHLPNTYTISLVGRLRLMYPNAEIVYIMGADNAIQISRWKKWKELVKLVPLLIFDRDGYHRLFMGSKLRANFRNGAVQGFCMDAFKGKSWYFVKLRKNPQSSTNIRHGKK